MWDIEEIREEILKDVKDIVPSEYIKIENAKIACNKAIYLIDVSDKIEQSTIGFISFGSAQGNYIELSAKPNMCKKYKSLLRKVYYCLHTISHRELIRFGVDPKDLESRLL